MLVSFKLSTCDDRGELYQEMNCNIFCFDKCIEQHNLIFPDRHNAILLVVINFHHDHVCVHSYYYH
jgi:hypothetical protein